MNLSNHKYIIFHKPYGVLCQFSAQEGDRTLADFGLPPDVYPAGRLDKDSEGLLILSSDGLFIHRLTDPKYDKEKTYLVQVEGLPEENDLVRLRRGLLIKDYKTAPCLCQQIDDPELEDRVPPIRFRKNIPTSWLEIILTEGKNRQVRRMTAAIGYPTLRLFRVKSGKISISNLKSGQWREVKRDDIL